MMQTFTDMQIKTAETTARVETARIEAEARRTQLLVLLFLGIIGIVGVVALALVVSGSGAAGADLFVKALLAGFGVLAGGSLFGRPAPREGGER